MSKTIDLQVEKSRSLIEGYRNSLNELQALGVTEAQLDSMEKNLEKLTAAGKECDELRNTLSEKVRTTNALMEIVKNEFIEQKKIVKNAYDQEAWQRYGIMDKR